MKTKLLHIIIPLSTSKKQIEKFTNNLNVYEENTLIVEGGIIEKQLIKRFIRHFKRTTVIMNYEINSKKLENNNIFGVSIIWKKKVRTGNELSFNIFTKLKKYFFQPSHIIIDIVKLNSENYLEEMAQNRQTFYRSVLGPVNPGRKRNIIDILNNESFKRTIDNVSTKPTRYKKVKKYLKEIATDKNYTTLKNVERFLDLIWHFTLEGIYIDTKGMDKIRELSKTKQIVYLPSHRSHVDYLLIGYLLLKNNMDVPLVAAGINLSFFPVGGIFRRCGAYYLRRTFKGNLLYSESFYAYLDSLMRLESNQMFYIEGGRSRTGKILKPKFGMMSMLVKAFLNNKLDDLYFVPLSTDYGKLFESKAYIEELRGAEKQKESIFAIFDTLKFLKRRQGITYIQFSEPFSLIEYLEVKGITDYKNEIEFNAMIKDLSFHVIHEINKVVTITPSAIISLILLSNPHRGINKNELLRVSHIIYNFLKRREYRLAIGEDNFINQFEHVLNNFAINNYVKFVHTDLDIVYKISDEYRPFLDYYKNTIIHLFLPLSFISIILKSQSKDELELEEVFHKINELKALFDHEFLYDEEVWQKETILETLKFLRFLKEIKITNNRIFFASKNSIWTNITSNIIRNFLEAYYIVVSKLILIEDPISEKGFFIQCQSYSQSLYEVGEISMIESNSKDIYKNALFYCESINCINSKDKIITITKNQVEDLKQLKRKIKSYLL